MKVQILDSVEEIPEHKEGLTLILYYENGEVVASTNWREIEIGEEKKYKGTIEIYNYYRSYYDHYIINGIKKIVIIEEK